MNFICAICKEVAVEEDNMICDDCFKKEAAAQERDEKIADYYNEQHRLRYKDIHLFDNGVNRISVVYCRKQICTWTYSSEGHNFFEQGRKDVRLTAKGYIEGWLDAIAATIRPRPRE